MNRPLTAAALFCSLLGAFLSCAAVSCSGPQRPPQQTRDERLRDLYGSGAPNSRGQQAGNGASARAGSPSVQDVAQRALLLRAMSELSTFPRAGESAAPAALRYFEEERQKLVEWLKREKVWGAATEGERTLLSTPVGTAPRGEFRDVASAQEELAVILWALRIRSELPALDAPAPSLPILGKLLPESGAATGDFIEDARLRPASEISRAHEAAEMWYLRGWVRDVVEQGQSPEAEALEPMVEDLRARAREANFDLGPIRDGRSFFQELIRFSAHDAHERRLIPRSIGNDFPALGKAYRDLSGAEHRRLSVLVRQRLKALNWLTGRGEEIDGVLE